MQQAHVIAVPGQARYLVPFSARRLPHLFAKVLVLGSGIAGLRAALAAAERVDVLVVTKSAAEESNTRYAQGGIAAPIPPGDSVEDHGRDTMEAGAGLCDPKVVRDVIGAAPDAVRELIAWGARFDTRRGKIDFAQEGGHGRPRVLHSGGDATGAEIERVLLDRARSHPRITLLERTFAIDLITRQGVVVGALTWDPVNGLRVISSGATVLATGGAGQLWRETTNPEIATGDGLALAFRAGATLADLEFMQFHPTTLYLAGATRALISEAVRGEGAVLRDRKGVRFMTDVHPQAELAPRDVVSRGIVRRMRETEDTNVYLDLTHLPAGQVRARFPGLASLCETFGLDIAKDPIPVRPAAHYMIGGVRVDARGRTTLRGLWACGEVAASGLHGANRLASNSLLEGLVCGRACGEAAAAAAARTKPGTLDVENEVALDGPGPIDLADARMSLRSLMWREVGLERDGAGLADAVKRLEFWSTYIARRVFHTPAGWEIQDLLTLANLVTRSALAREESRGVHYRTDRPERDDQRWKRHVEVVRWD